MTHIDFSLPNVVGAVIGAALLYCGTRLWLPPTKAALIAVASLTIVILFEIFPP